MIVQLPFARRRDEACPLFQLACISSTTSRPQGRRWRAVCLAFAMSPGLVRRTRGPGFIDPSQPFFRSRVEPARIRSPVSAGAGLGARNFMRRPGQGPGRPGGACPSPSASGAESPTLDDGALEGGCYACARCSSAPIEGQDHDPCRLRDGVRRAAKNVRLALQRVGAVRDASRREHSAAGPGPAVEERAYGPLAPVACNDTDADGPSTAAWKSGSLIAPGESSSPGPRSVKPATLHLGDFQPSRPIAWIAGRRVRLGRKFACR